MTTAMVLMPWDRREAITLVVAAGIAGVTPETVRLWCIQHGIGRKIGGRWRVSRPALLMFLENDRAALRAYHSGDRTGERVRGYFER